ncbi:hypothetical protein [Roseateles sp.]|uniref:hypothetical protein n=1 Tax=Roseateles sp. TaxID=1971397 RepID=UPI00392288B8
MKRLVPIVLVALATNAIAQDRAEIDPTKIVGNRELPKVLYIVPWKKPVPGQLTGKPVASVLDEVLAPVDREVFRRQVAYQAQAQTQAQVQASAPPKPDTPPPPTTEPAPQRRAP